MAYRKYASERCTQPLQTHVNKKTSAKVRAAARSEKQTLSQWIRAAIEEKLLKEGF